MKKFFAISAIALVVASLAASFYLSSPAHAVDVLTNCPGSVCEKRSLFGEGSVFANILKVITFALGAVAVIMIIVGGLKYITAGGDQSKITSAKNTILYSVVGLVVAIMAGAIVAFVVNNLG